MRVERLLQVNVAAMVLLGAVLLGMGERNPALPLWMTAATVAAFLLTDLTGWFSLNRTMVNVGAVAALLLSLLGLRRFDGLMQVFVIADLLVYLQVILLFEKKEMRVYWLLMLLSLMQVVVAAAFEQEVWFGILLFGYLFAGLATMTFLYLHQEQLRRQSPETPAALPAGHRWPLAGQQASFASAVSGRAGLGGGLFVRMVGMTVVVAIIAAAVFLFMPRLGHGDWRQAAGKPLLAVGFTDSVALGELGRVIEDTKEVMRVRLFDQATGERYHVGDSIYLRGAVLNHYERGRWSYRARESQGRYPWLRRSMFPLGQKLVRQDIAIEPMDRDELFAIWPFAPFQDDKRLVFDLYHQRLTRPKYMALNRFSYRLLTPALQQGVQVPLLPYPFDALESPSRLLEPVPARGPDGLPGLIALARQWIDAAPLASKDQNYCATMLERQLRTSKQFQYSLEGQQRDPQLDPIEDFITKHPSGHCEYFATALVLMLRSRGIPARLVVGYKCDEWNALGGFYQVRQLHAHTWVEAYLGPREIPADVRGRFRQWDWSVGGWLRLDPTPGSDELSLTNRLLVRTNRYFFWLDYVWNNYIAEMDWSRQRRAIYDPAVQVVADTGRNLIDPQRWRKFFSNLGQSLDVASWLRWPVGLGLLGLIVVTVGSYYGLRAMVRPHLVRWGLRRVNRVRRRIPQVEFYRRMEAILARHGLIRTVSQTPRELAVLARTQLIQWTGDSQLAQLPEQLVDTFYRVRFGRASLDKLQSHGVEQALKQLERAVRSSHENRSGRL